MTLLERIPVVAALVLAALAVAAVLAWELRLELIVLFAAALFGTALYAAAAWAARRTGLSRKAAVVVGYVLAWMLAAGFFWLAGRSVSSQAGRLNERIPDALEELESRLEGRPFVSTLADDVRVWRARMDSLSSPEDQVDEGGAERVPGEAEGPAGQDAGPSLMRLTFTTVTNLFIWAVLVFYIAYEGDRYVNGAVRLFPPERRHVARELAATLGSALPWWLVGRAGSMAVVALLTLPALLILGVPLAFTLALMAGLFSFVPFLGPLAATVPAALIALQAVPDRLVWVLAAYGLIQLLESYVITPRIQDRAVSVPPVLLISAQVVMGVLAGIPGVMFATPVVLTLMVIVEVVYLKHGLGEDAPHTA